MPSLPPAAEALLSAIEEDLKIVLEPTNNVPAPYFNMMHYHMGWTDPVGTPLNKTGGKRVRPVLAFLSSIATCGKYDPARPAAAAVELIHNFSLLHDDVEDQSPQRRGRDAVWTIWGAPQAINAGDAMFTLAHLAIPRLANRYGVESYIADLLRILDDTALELTRGQYLDMSFEEQLDVTPDDYLDMIAGKTAALFAASARMGALSAGADADLQDVFHAFGHSLGMAFQIQDDFLDVWGSSEDIGKKRGQDIRKRKKALPAVFGLANVPGIRPYYESTHELSNDEVEDVISQLEAAKTDHYVKETAEEFWQQALTHLDETGTSGEVHDTLTAYSEMLFQRKS